MHYCQKQQFFEQQDFVLSHRLVHLVLPLACGDLSEPKRGSNRMYNPNSYLVVNTILHHELVRVPRFLENVDLLQRQQHPVRLLQHRGTKGSKPCYRLGRIKSIIRNQKDLSHGRECSQFINGPFPRRQLPRMNTTWGFIRAVQVRKGR